MECKSDDLTLKKIGISIDTSITHIRPRFKFEVPYTATYIMDHVADVIKETPSNVRATVIDQHVVLDIVGEDVHYWSPQLNFRVEEYPDDENKSVISGLIGPRPNVWTMFMFVYFSTGVIGFFISSYGVSKWMLGEYTAFIWAFPIAVLFMLTAYRAGKYGETLGKDQIEILKQFVRDAVFLEK